MKVYVCAPRRPACDGRKLAMSWNCANACAVHGPDHAIA
jgi:hypothetical protein